MSRLLSIAIGAALGFAVSAPIYAADTVQSSTNATTHTTAMSDTQASEALDKCKGMTGTEGARCVVNIRPAGGGGTSRAVSVREDDENVVKTGLFTDDEYAAAVRHCEEGKPKNRDRCIANVKNSFGRM
jgi:hypothetical protein